MRYTSIVVTALVGFVLLASSTTTFAQTTRASAKTQVISGDFVGLFLDGKEVHIQYEWKASPVNSWFIRALYGRDPLKYNGLGVGGGYRFFIADSRALTGLAVAPVVLAYFWSHEFLPAETFFSLGGEVSYKWLFDDFTVEPLVGAGIAFGGDNISYLTTIRPYLGIYLGYAW